MVKQAITKVQRILLLSEIRIENNSNKEITNDEESKLISMNIPTEEKQEKCEDFVNLLKLNFEINPGELIMIVGKVGSGKSRLLLNLLGEETIYAQNYLTSNSVAYYCESPWIFNSSIKDNILMGREYNPDLYNNVIKCCCLDEDIENMPNNDETIVSDRGTTLSGGQKARLCLARVLYSQFDVFLLDDPLASLDSKVCKKVFKRCLLKKLANKTRIIVMRNYDYLQYADKILMIDGDNSFFGNFDEFMKKYSPSDINQFVISRGLNETNEKGVLKYNHIKDINIEENIYEMPLKAKTYYKYFMLGFESKFLILITAILFISNTSSVAFFYYYSIGYVDSSPTSQKSLIYLALLVVVYISFMLPIILLTHGIGISNKKLHENALKTVSKLPSNYFDKNSSGVILNKLTRDTSVVDNILMAKIQALSFSCFVQISIVIFVMIIQPFSIIPLSILLVLYYFSIVHILPICHSIRR